MNKRMLRARAVYNRITIDPAPRRITFDGEELQRLDDEWIVEAVNNGYRSCHAYFLSLVTRAPLVNRRWSERDAD